MLRNNSEGSMIFLIGNKIDLENEREVTKEKGEKFKSNYDDIKMFFEISALKCINIDNLLDNISISIYEKNKKLENEENNALQKTITIVKDDFLKKGKKKKKKWC